MVTHTYKKQNSKGETKTYTYEYDRPLKRGDGYITNHSIFEAIRPLSNENRAKVLEYMRELNRNMPESDAVTV